MPQLAEGPSIVTQDLVFYTDFKNRKCYPGTGTTINDLSKINGTSIGSSAVVFGEDYLQYIDTAGYIEFNKNLLFHNNNELTVTTLISRNVYTTDLPLHSITDVLDQNQLGWAVYNDTSIGTRLWFVFINSVSLQTQNNYVQYYYEDDGTGTSSSEIFIISFTYKRNPLTTVFSINCYVNDKKVTNQLVDTSFLPVQGQYQYNIYNHNKLTIGNNLYPVGENSLGRQCGGLVYSRALTDAEVLQNHKALRGRYQELWQ